VHIAESPVEHAERLPHFDGSPSLFHTPEGAARFPDSAYVSRQMEPYAAEWTVLPPSEYQTPSRDASSSTLAPSPTTERVDKSEQLTRKDRRASLSPRASHREQHRGRTSQGSGYGDKKAAAPRRNAQSTQSLEWSRARFQSSGTSKGTRVQLRWNDLDDTLTETKGSSTDDEKGARSPRASNRDSRSRSRTRSHS